MKITIFFRLDCTQDLRLCRIETFLFYFFFENEYKNDEKKFSGCEKKIKINNV